MGGRKGLAAMVVLAGALLGFVPAHPAGADQSQAPGFTHEELEPLLTALEADGFARATVQPIFFDPRLRRVERAVTYNVLNPDSANLYEQFSSPFAIRLALRFKRHHLRALQALQRQYGVAPNIIAGILLVETQFGTAELRYRLLEVFTSLIVAASPGAIDAQYQRMKADYPTLEREYLVQRLTKKAVWAYDELKALLRIREQLQVDSVYDVMGSYAGAFGMPQFVPTSYVRWATDGNRDHRVDLDDAPDAMASIANFLYQHGWRANASQALNMRAVWEYNHSPHYVQAILDIAHSMERAERRSRAARPAPVLAGAGGTVPPAAVNQAIGPTADPGLLAAANNAPFPTLSLPQQAGPGTFGPLPDKGPLRMDAIAP